MNEKEKLLNQVMKLRKEIRKDIDDKKVEIIELNKEYKKLDSPSKNKQDRDYTKLQEKEKELTTTGKKLEERKLEVTPKGKSAMLAKLYNNTKDGISLKGKTNIPTEAPKMEKNQKNLEQKAKNNTDDFTV